MSNMRSVFARVALLTAGLTIAGSLWAQQSREDIIAERLEAADSVCLAGDPCASGSSSVPAANTGGSMQVAQADNGDFSPEAVYEQRCAMCHNTGMANAPMLDDSDEWASRLEEKGFDTIVQNSIDGINAMPPRGMCNDCTDEQMEELVEYMMGDVLSE